LKAWVCSSVVADKLRRDSTKWAGTGHADLFAAASSLFDPAFD
jgi:hypothetical protein